MQFDHRVAATKVHTIHYLARHASITDLVDELRKCDVVCANCHAIRTHRRQAKKYRGKYEPIGRSTLH